jgi:hypothetical protein
MSNSDQDVIEILDPVLRQGFAQLPRAVLKAPKLSRNAKCLYALLLDYAWQEGSCFPGQLRLSKDLDVSKRTIIYDLNELREYGLIDWRQRGMNKTNIYYILPLAKNPRLQLAINSKVELQDSATPELQDFATLELQDSANIIDSGVNQTQSELDPVSISKGIDLVRDGLIQSQSQPTPSAGVEPIRVGELLPQVQTRLKISKRGRPPKATPTIAHYVTELSAIHLHDEEHTKSNITHAMRLYKASEKSESDFVSMMLEAKAVTLDWTANIKKETREQGVKNRAPYFFAVLEDLLGIRQEQNGEESTVASMDRGQGEKAIAPQFNWDDVVTDQIAYTEPDTAHTNGTTELDILWQKVLVELAAQMTAANFSAWLRESRLIELEQNKAVVVVPTQFQKEHLALRFTGLVNKIFSAVQGHKISTGFITLSDIT